MTDILHFGGLKMRFLKVAETFCSNYMAADGRIFGIFVA